MCAGTSRVESGAVHQDQRAPVSHSDMTEPKLQKVLKM